MSLIELILFWIRWTCKPFFHEQILKHLVETLHESFQKVQYPYSH